MDGFYKKTTRILIFANLLNVGRRSRRFLQISHHLL